MADWRDVMEARRDADALATEAQSAYVDSDEALHAALLSIRSEVRALAMLIDYTTAKHAAATGRP